MEPPLSTSYFDNLALLINEADLDEEGRERSANFAGMLSSHNSILHFVSELGITLPQILRWLRSPFLKLDVGGIKQLQALQLDLHTQAAALDAIHCLREICNSDAPALQRRLAATKLLALNEPEKQAATRQRTTKPAPSEQASPASKPAHETSTTQNSNLAETPPKSPPHHPKTPADSEPNPPKLVPIEPASCEPSALASPQSESASLESSQPTTSQTAPAEVSISKSQFAQTQQSLTTEPITTEPLAAEPARASLANDPQSSSSANEPDPVSQTALLSNQLAPHHSATQHAAPHDETHSASQAQAPSIETPASHQDTTFDNASSNPDAHARHQTQDRQPEPEVPRENPGLPLPPRIYSSRRGYPVRN